MGNDVILYGEKVAVYSLKQEDVESYLHIYKRASALSEAYDRMPDFWEHTYQSIKDDIFNENGSKKRYLIAEKDFLQRHGYIELDYGNPAMPEANIAILEEHMGKGYATDASRILFAYILEKESIKCVVWHAFSRNTASCKVAVKGLPIGTGTFHGNHFTAASGKPVSQAKKFLCRCAKLFDILLLAMNQAGNNQFFVHINPTTIVVNSFHSGILHIRFTALWWHNILHFAASKKHIGLYPGPEAVIHFAEELQGYKTEKGTIRIPYGKVDAALVGKIAEWC